MKHVSLVMVLLGVATACQGPKSKEMGRVIPQPVPLPPSSASGPETMRVPETVFQDRATLTLMRMNLLGGYLNMFVAAHSKLPSHFEELRTFSNGGFEIASVDGWSRKIEYGAADDRQYTFRSAGADAEFGTTDDVLYAGLSGRSEPCLILPGDGRRFVLGTDEPDCARP